MLFYNLNKEQKQIITLSSIGGMLEFYDFTIYGLFAVYFTNQFFPSHNQLISIVASYTVFLVGYVVRPLGGILFSHIGDEIGRKTVLIITMVLMGIASFGMGLLPNYAQIGVLAPILMLFCRLIQGLAIGGELPSMIVYVTESMPDKRGFGMGGVFAGTVSGLIPGMLINLAITHYLTTDQINSFGWRIPFILGGLLCFVAYQVRKKLQETRAFQNIKAKDKFPFIELLRHHLKEVAIGVGLVSIMATPIALVIIFMPTYLHKIVGLPVHVVSHVVLIATIICIVFTYVMGMLANKFNIVKLMIGGIVLLVISAILCYSGLAHNYNLILSIGIFAVFQGALITLPPIFLSYLFPIHVRLSGVALSYNIAFVIFAGLTPIIVTSIIGKTGWIFASPMLWMGVVAIIALIATFKAHRYVK
jgi:MFS family permease